MRITILLHSTTGNTRLVTRYAARRLEAAGHDVTVHDIVKRRGEEPALLRHRSLLGDEEVALVRVEDENTPDRKKDEENVEGEQSERDAGGMAKLQDDSSVYR